MSADITLMSYESLRDDFLARTGNSVSAINTASWLGNAYKSCWELCKGKSWMWSWALQTGALTVTNGVIALSSIAYGRWYSIWSADPRIPGANSAYPVPTIDDASGIYPQTSGLSSVFGFWLPVVPEFSSTAVAVTTDYATNAIVIDPSSRTGGTGDCYRCITGYTTPATDNLLTTDLANPVKWQLQKVYKNFQSATAQMAQAIFLRSIANYEQADKMESLGREDLDEEFRAVHPRGPVAVPPVWMGIGAWR